MSEAPPKLTKVDKAIALFMLLAVGFAAVILLFAWLT